MADDQDLDTGQAQADDNQADDQQPPDGGQDDGQADGQQEPQKPFTPEQEQYMGSWMGRIISKQFDEKVLPVIQQNQPAPPPQPPGGDSALDEFNEKLQDMVLGGNVTGALQLYNQVQTQATENLTKTNRVQTDRALTSFSDEPYYKDVFKEAQSMAHDMVAKGFPPDTAAEYAYTKAEAKHLKKKLNPSTEPQGMLEGGRRQPSDKKPKLPAQFKKAYERDKKKGFFKDEQDYINNLSPAIRAKYGI